MAEWHYVANGQPVGPVTADDIHWKFRDGTIKPDTLIWTDGMPGWQAIHEVGDFDSLTKKKLPPPIPETPPAGPEVPVISVNAVEDSAEADPHLEIDERPVSALERQQTDLSNLRMSKTMNFVDDWARYDLPDVWKRNATMKDGNHPAALLLRQVGSSFWRLVYVDQVSKSRNVENPEITKALLASVGVK